MNTGFYKLIHALVVGLLLFSTACGPEEPETDSTLLMRQAEQAALEYQNHKNLDAARSALNDIEVANSSQWLIMVTESALTKNADPLLMNALVTLATDLSLQSQTIEAYAIASGIIPDPQAVVDVARSEQRGSGMGVVALPAQTDSDATTTTSNVETEVVEVVVPVIEPAVEATAEPAPAVEVKPLLRALDAINIRGGPGVNYGIVDAAQAGQEFVVTGKSPAGDWWQVLLNSGQSGWIFGQLAEAFNVEQIAVAQNIPEPPPTVVPLPPAEPAPAVQPAPAVPEAPAEPEAPPVDTSNPYFTLTERYLVAKKDNGDCKGRHLLRIYVKDANGNLLNGVKLKGVYVGDEIDTGSQGKGDGLIEYDLHGSGEAFRVIRDADGRDAASDEAGGFTTRSNDIDKPTLIAAGYCSDEADCDVFYKSFGCQGHHSYIATFTRNY